MIYKMTKLITRNETHADKAFSDAAIKNRNQIIIYYKYYTKILNSSDYTPIDYDHGYKNYVMMSSNHLRMDYPEDDTSYMRDYYIIRDSESIYFTGYFEDIPKSRLKIKGREAWITEMFVDKLISKCVSGLYPVYMYSEDMKCWCQLSNNLGIFKWNYIPRPPKPSGIYAGYGTDPISDSAIKEIGLLI